MATREMPPNEGDLYDARGEVPPARPITQGDVFRNVSIPGFEDDSIPAAIITQHPCSMRAGSVLRPRIMVAAVRRRGKIGDNDWQGNASAMLLPNLLGDAKDYQADFRDSGSAKASQLARANRIATLTNYGIQILHQRNIYYHTRLTVDIPTLAETYEPIAAELELQYDWAEAKLQAAVGYVDPLDVIASAEEEFGAHLDENDRALRTRLQSSVSRADVRRQVRREMMKRYGG